ncbi:MAG: GGDEF domain-containing protein [Cellulomonadaceae bacterium]|nr:GGDEF domain-containing protein [Cellulomonadaceae bacterium]
MDPAAAARAAAGLMLAAAAVTLAFAFSDPSVPSTAWRMAVVGASAAVLPLAWALFRWGARAPSITWFLVPALGVVLIAGMDVATNDASAAGQVFLAFPVVFAASQLRPATVAVVTALAVVADAVVALSVLAPARALTDTAFVAASLIAMAVLLSGARQRQEALIRQLSAEAQRDPLTGLSTRRVLDDSAEQLLSRLGPQGCTGVGLVLLDLDRFKVLNDTHGHPVGDDALAHLAELLRQHSGPDVVLSRLGGDEIAVLLPGYPRAEAVQFASDLAELVRTHPLPTPRGPVALSVSGGIAHAPGDGVALRELYAAADAALYRAKQGGRDQVVSALATSGPRT